MCTVGIKISTIHFSIKKIAVALLLFGCLHPIWANRINVANATQITSAMNTAAPGDTLVMQNGTWSNQLINFGGANGAPGNPIVLLANTPGGVSLEGTSRLRIYGNYLEVNGLIFQNCNAASFGTNPVVEFRNGSTLANNSRLTNCHFYQYNSDNALDNKWVTLYGTYNKVDYCRFEGKSNYGATVTVVYQSAGGFPAESPSTYHLIDHNHFLNRTLPLGGNGGESLRVGDSNTSRTNGYNTISNNLFENCDGEIEVISNKSEFNTYQYNTFVGNAGGLTLRHGASCIVRGNFFFGGGDAQSAGVRLIDGLHSIYNNYFQDIEGGDNSNLRSPIVIMNGQTAPAANGYWPVYNSTIAHNTMVNCLAPSINFGSSVSGGTVPPNNITLANNLISASSGPLVAYTNTPTAVTYQTNLYFGAALGDPPTAGWINANPLLGFDTGSFHLTDNSPAIDAATGNYGVSTDYDGQNRTGSKDIGCDEYSSDALLITPLEADQVGVCWLSNGNIPCSLINPTLSAELLHFECDFANGKTTAFWQTANEKDILYYVLEYRTAQSQWEEVAARQPMFTTLNEYDAQHTFITTENTVFYRVKTVNTDQNAQYSPIIALHIPVKETQPVLTPTIGEPGQFVHLQPEVALSDVHLYTASGQLVYTKTIADHDKVASLRIPTFVSGGQWYLFKITTTNGHQYSYRVWVK
jgi:poly(beta-D-mannuronate) lyase